MDTEDVVWAAFGALTRGAAALVRLATWIWLWAPSPELAYPLGTRGARRPRRLYRRVWRVSRVVGWAVTLVGVAVLVRTVD